MNYNIYLKSTHPVAVPELGHCYPIGQGVDVVFQKSVHGFINPPLNYTAHPVELSPCLIGVQGITILYPLALWDELRPFLAPPFG